MKRSLCFTAILLANLLPGIASASQWGYEGEGSPEHWSEVSPENQLCQKGMNQSPINIDKTLKAHINPLKNTYTQGPVSIINNGHTVQANFAENSKNSVAIDGVPFMLQQLHFHAPSENTLHGKQYPLEMHLVHKNADGEVAVVAVMFNIGAANSTLTKLWAAMPAQTDNAQPLAPGIDVNGLLPKDKTHYRFTGSLTTPPCSEGVSWLVLKHPVTLSEAQLKQFTDAMHHHNNRPTQPLHGRVVVE